MLFCFILLVVQLCVVLQSNGVPWTIEHLEANSESYHLLTTKNAMPKRHCCNHTHCRRIEDKLDSRQLMNQLITIRMECPPASKKVPLQMLGWIVMLEGAVEENIFKGSQLMTDRPEN